MGKHPTYVVGYKGSIEELAKAIGNMSYDQTSSFIEKLADDLKKQADSDLIKGRKNLANKLYNVVDNLYKTKKEMDKVWKLCEPHTTKINRS